VILGSEERQALIEDDSSKRLRLATGIAGRKIGNGRNPPDRDGHDRVEKLTAVGQGGRRRREVLLTSGSEAEYQTKRLLAPEAFS
jgi:hypothetical protein